MSMRELAEQASKLQCEIEGLPCGEQQTKVSVMAYELYRALKNAAQAQATADN